MTVLCAALPGCGNVTNGTAQGTPAAMALDANFVEAQSFEAVASPAWRGRPLRMPDLG